MVDIAAIILTHNEERHLRRALESIRSFARQVFVIDSYSTDSTRKIAEEFGAVVLQHPFANYAKQFQWALENAPIDTEWILRLDADEIIEPDLAAQIATQLPNLPSHTTGINLLRKHIFWGRWIRHGGRYPLVLLRIWRRGKGRIENRWMDEHIVLTEGTTITLHGGFSDHNLNDLTFFVEKHNKYATREAIDVINQRHGFHPRDDALTSQSISGQAVWRRLVKERLYNKIPFELASAAYFIYRYIFQLGFLDGREGLVYHFLQGFWYRFLVGAKVRELEAAIRGMDDIDLIQSELSRLTGLDIRSR
jgi:glycosyltransferase involved in cell wall biosynthesis